MKTEPNHDTMVALTELNYLKCFLLRCTNRYSRTTKNITKTKAKITLTAIRAFLYASSPFSVWRWGALFPVECSCKALVWAADVTILLEVVFVILLVVAVAVDCVGRRAAIKQENNDEIKHPYIYFCLALKITKNLRSLDQISLELLNFSQFSTNTLFTGSHRREIKRFCPAAWRYSHPRPRKA